MSAEVPFKDFLIFLYHSASSSPSSTRVSSSSQNNLTKTPLNNKINNDQKHALKNKTPRMIEMNIHSSQAKTIKGMHDQNPQNKSLPSSSSSSSLHKTPQSSSKRNSVNPSKVSILNHQPDDLTKEDKKPEKNHSTKSSRRGSKSIKEKSNNPSGDSKMRSSKSNIIDERKEQTGHNGSVESVDNYELDLLAQKSELEKKSLADNNSAKLCKNHDKISKSSKRHSRELLADYPIPLNKANKSEETIIDKEDDEADIDCQYEDVIHHDNDHLGVHETHDLSFYKNFSATTRSKSSLSYNIFTKSTTGDDNHHCYYHHQQYQDDNHHQSIYYSLLSNNRLSRSTPIHLDMITSVANSENSNPDEEFEPPDHLYDDDYETFSIRSEDRIDSTVNSANSRKSVKSPHTDIASKASSSRMSGHSSLRRIIDENHEDEPDMKILETSEVDNMMLESNIFIRNSQSSPALISRDNKSNPSGSIPSPRRINTSNAMAIFSSRHKRSPTSSGCPNRTTLTVTMDTSSLFLDTVYVNLKQDVDRSTNIKLYY